jgi:[NiFe] hydrogenase diaphorase moiety small subunit
MTSPTFSLDGVDVPFTDGQSILAAALAAGVYVPYLCYHPEFTPHGSCKVCTVKVNGRTQASCTTPARAGDVVESNVDEVTTSRRELVQLLFTEGNHFCPSCEASGNCTLQGGRLRAGHDLVALQPAVPRSTDRRLAPRGLLDFNRCILCELCVRASALVDRKDVFALSGRGVTKHLVVNAESGRLADTTLTVDDKAMSVCPVGVILRKRRGFAVPIGQRRYDAAPVSVVAVAKPEGDEP